MKTENEIWRDIPGYEGHYQCSTLGRVRSLTKFVIGYHGEKKRIGKILSQGNGKYLNVRLSVKNKAKTFLVHKLVAVAFVPNPHSMPTVNHEDGNKHNNHFKNLTWASHSDQIKHAIKTGLFTPPPPPTKRGDKLSDVTKKRMSLSRKGRIVTQETRSKISESLKRHNSQNS